MASGLEIVIHHGRDFERLLTDQMKAEGSGLGEKLKSVQHRLPKQLVSRLWYIVKVRNKAAHEAIVPDDIDEFDRLCLDVKSKLEKVIRELDARSAPGYSKGTLSTSAGPAGFNRRPASKQSARRLLVFFIVLWGGIWFLVSHQRANQTEYQAPAGQTKMTVSSSPGMASRPPIPTHSTTTASPTSDAQKTHESALAPTPPAVAHPPPRVPADEHSAMNGNSVYVKHNAVVSFHNIRTALRTGSFGEKRWMLRGTITNRTGVTLSWVKGIAYFYVPGHRQALGPVKVSWFLGNSGLAPGASQSFSFKPGNFGFSGYILTVPDVINASTLGAVVTLTDVTDGMGKDHSALSPIKAVSHTPIGHGYRAGNGFKFSTNSLVGMSNVRVAKETGSFGDKKWALRGTITNKTSKTLSMVYIESTVYVPGQPGRLTGAKQSIYLGQSGLAPGASMSFDVHLADFFSNYSVSQPTVLNAPTLGVSTKVTKATDGMNQTIYP